jgi:hypothetical protein
MEMIEEISNIKLIYEICLILCYYICNTMYKLYTNDKFGVMK